MAAVPGEEALESQIDLNTFNQILEMDDSPSNRDFSRDIVLDFFTQAQETFEKMDGGLAARDLRKLSELGHYLKGSSATLGLVKVKDHCEKIQRYGKHENLDGTPLPDDDECLRRITEALASARSDFERAEALLTAFFDG